ncbi:MAG: flavin reductase family protein [Elusimicrobiota bacterium]|jgi:ferric-chelate reductase [NAD(P)H]|nr:flavin reductase family protein [Elusimicrobiota bacterium]
MSLDTGAFDDISYGLYIVGAHNGAGKANAMIANSVFQVTARPCKIAACINKDALTHEYIKACGRFSVQPVKEGADMAFIGNWGFRTGRNFDKFAKYKYELSASGMPCVRENTLDFFEARVLQTLDLGTHTMFVGEVETARVMQVGRPLTYAYYKQIMRGLTPRGATTYKAVL